MQHGERVLQHAVLHPVATCHLPLAAASSVAQFALQHFNEQLIARQLTAAKPHCAASPPSPLPSLHSPLFLSFSLLSLFPPFFEATLSICQLVCQLFVQHFSLSQRISHRNRNRNRNEKFAAVQQISHPPPHILSFSPSLFPTAPPALPLPAAKMFNTFN